MALPKKWYGGKQGVVACRSVARPCWRTGFCRFLTPFVRFLTITFVIISEIGKDYPAEDHSEITLETMRIHRMKTLRLISLFLAACLLSMTLLATSGAAQRRRRRNPQAGKAKAAKRIGIGTVAGAGAGALINGKKGALIGAGAGAAGGTAYHYHKKRQWRRRHRNR